MDPFRPDSVPDLASAVRAALAESCPLEIRAGGSKPGFGRPVAADRVLDISALSGILDHDPAELVLSARAATSLAEIEAALEPHGQMLGFEPPALHRLYGAAGEPTIGGILAANLGGPRRLTAGAARDHLLGFTAVNGFGEIWKAGGRVVKNVSGYDMARLQCGALGTLSVLAEVTLRLLPRPAAATTLLVPAPSPAAAVALMARLLRLPLEISAACFLPAPVAVRAGIVAEPLIALRLEGPEPSILDRACTISRLAAPLDRLGQAASDRFWHRVGAVAPLLSPDRLIWRLCPPPAEAPAVLERVRVDLPDVEYFLDWGGAQLWLALPGGVAHGGAEWVRAALGDAGGASLIRAPAALRQMVPVFQPAPPALEALSVRIKQAFDPARILNPGRIVEGR